ncbi:YIP1 family protein [Permianibacter sp. IMCC34836]|uniref:Yip1 family protein n=1 Tax=Permianibacter fluminis TaxID=2738515 RepID=UPI0015565EF2|nr:Yip1 family protein [Permianibacter fluminis]NQD35632.1 YIP1 family protein [Permianibacter fluminis]
MSDLNTEQPGTTGPSAPDAPPLSIWRDMWLKPRAVLRQEIGRPPRLSQWLPAILAGIAAVLETFALAQSGTLPTTVPTMPATGLQGLLTMALLLGPLSGLLHVFIMAFLLRQLGRWFGGTVTPSAMRRGISLALVPMAYSLLLVVLEMLWREPGVDSLLIRISTGIRTVLNVWFLLLLVMTVSELQQLPLRRAILTVGSALLLLLSLFLLLRGPL